MLTVDIKSLLRRLNPYCTSGLEGAAGLCVSRTHYEVTAEHFFLKLLENPASDICLLLAHQGVDVGRVQKALHRSMEEFRSGNAAKPVFSPLLLEWLQEGWLVASVDLDEARVRSGALLLAFLNRPRQFADGSYVDLLTAASRDAVQDNFWAATKGSVEKALRESEIAETTGPPGEATALQRYCTDFTEKAASGDIDPVFGRDREIRQMVDILARRRKNNPIVVGEAGVGKTAVVEGLALRIVEGDVPDLLTGVRLLGLDMGLLQAGAGMKGEFENRLKAVINEIKASEKPIILFIDEAHTLIGAGGSAGMSDAANLLKPALARGELRTVAATTWSEYKKYFEKDAALARRFQLVKLDEPSEESTKLILRGLKAKYEAAHQVVVRDDAIEAAAELSNRYISGRQLPDKAVDLLDTSAARVKIMLTAKPDVIEDRERRIQALDRETRAIDRDRDHGLAVDPERAGLLSAEREHLTAELSDLNNRWQNEQALVQQVIALRLQLSDAEATATAEIRSELEAAGQRLSAVQGTDPLVRAEVDPDIVAKVVADWTGIPVGKVMRDEARTVMQLGQRLKERIRGQDEALDAIVQVIMAAKAGIKDPAQPLGVFLLAGPSGVGKTETGLAMADLLFGGEHFMVTVNMSEFQEKHTVSRLIGSPPGYVGYGEGGVLTEAVRQRPYSVVLIDEVEKGHPEVMNLFYQVFDKGELADGEGRAIDFKNTVIFMTSNLGTDIITEMCSESPSPPLESLGAAVRPLLSNHFKPALLARMKVLPYQLLPADVLKEIVVLKLEKLVRRLHATHRIALSYAPALVDQIAERCTEVETGARNIDHIMSGTIMPRLSQEILTCMSSGELPSSAHLALDDSGGFTVVFGGPS